MKVEYDQQADALYIEVRSVEVARTTQVEPGTLVDLDANGQLLGVEIIRPARPWPLAEILSQFPVDLTNARLLHLLARAGGDAGTFPYAQPVLVSA